MTERFEYRRVSPDELAHYEARARRLRAEAAREMLGVISAWVTRLAARLAHPGRRSLPLGAK